LSKKNRIVEWYFKFAIAVCGLLAIANLLTSVIGEARSAEAGHPVIVHANALICASASKLEEGIIYWQEGDLKGFGMITNSDHCVLTTRPFKAFLVMKNEKYSRLNYEVNDGKVIGIVVGWIANGAYSDWAWE